MPKTRRTEAPRLRARTPPAGIKAEPESDEENAKVATSAGPPRATSPSTRVAAGAKSATSPRPGVTAGSRRGEPAATGG
eukprot:59648-Pyramimonas_sp.AAC.1